MYTIKTSMIISTA